MTTRLAKSFESSRADVILRTLAEEFDATVDSLGVDVPIVDVILLIRAQAEKDATKPASPYEDWDVRFRYRNDAQNV